MAGQLSHIDESGRARMVDIGQKPDSERVAAAKGAVYMQPETLQLIIDGNVKKGDVLAVAQLAGEAVEVGVHVTVLFGGHHRAGARIGGRIVAGVTLGRRSCRLRENQRDQQDGDRSDDRQQLPLAA